MKKILFLTVLSLILILGACSGSNSGDAKDASGSNDDATNYPEENINIVVPFSPGGTTDNTIRKIASVLPDYLPNDVSIVVENKPGGTGVIGTQEVVDADPDGYTLLYDPVIIAGLQDLFDKADYNYEDLDPIINVQASQSVMLVDADAPWDSFDEWLEYVKDNPGEFQYGTPGVGSSQHLAMEAFNIDAGLETKMIPFEGNSDSLTALLGGNIDGVIIQGHEASEHVEDGSIKPLFHLGDGKYFSDVPVLKDEGYENVLSDPSSGLFAPKGLSEEKKEIIYNAFSEALKDPEVVEFFEDLDLEPEGTGLGDFEQSIEEQYDIVEKVLEEVDVK